MSAGTTTGRKSERGIYEKVPGSGIWWARYADATGKIHRDKVGLKSHAKAFYRLRKAEVLQRKKLPESLPARRLTFAQIAADALEYSETHKKSYNDDRERMKLLLEMFGNATVDTLTPSVIEHKLMAAKRDRGWAPATVNRYKALLSLTFSIALRNGRVENNPVRLVRRLREDNVKVRYLSREEEAKLQSVIEPAHPERWAQVLFAAYTGLRAKEQRELSWKDIDREHRQLWLGKTKNGRPRIVQLNDTAFQALNTASEYSQKEVGRIFPDKPYRVWFDLALKKAGIENFTWHCLRHTFASRMVMEGVDIRTVAEQMGHKTLQMTMRYAHLAPEHSAAAVAKLDSFRNRTDTKTSTEVLRASLSLVPVFRQVASDQ